MSKQMREMKDSGIEWIGEIPKEWETTEIKHYCLSVFAGGTPQSNNQSYWGGDIPWLPSGSCHDCKIYSAPKTITKSGFENSSTKLIPKNTALVAMTGATCGNTGYLTFESCANQSVTAYVENPKIANSLFIWYILQAAKTHLLTYQTGGAQGGINVENCKNIVVPFVPMSEQVIIADYLDDKCGKIDRYIEQQKQVIEKLKAYKQSVITEAVTKGLDPTVPMKDSGVEWIGEIPEHWKIGKIGYVTTKIGSGKTPKGGAEVYSLDGVLFLRSQNIYDDGLRIDDATFITEEIDEEMSNTRVYKDDVLLNITGGSIGRSCIYSLDEHANVNQHVCIIRTTAKEITPRYMHYFWISDSGHTSISIHQTGANREGLNFEQISKTLMPFMPISEQRDICDYLDKKCFSIDSAIKEKQTLIEKLTEYKKSLIYEVATGKKEV